MALSPAAITESEKLRGHARKGCLSNIPPTHGGTQGDEILHKCFKRNIRQVSLTVDYALVLVGTFFYRWNEKKLRLIPGGVINPADVYGKDEASCTIQDFVLPESEFDQVDSMESEDTNVRKMPLPQVPQNEMPSSDDSIDSSSQNSSSTEEELPALTESEIETYITKCKLYLKFEDATGPLIYSLSSYQAYSASSIFASLTFG